MQVQYSSCYRLNSSCYRLYSFITQQVQIIQSACKDNTGTEQQLVQIMPLLYSSGTDYTRTGTVHHNGQIIQVQYISWYRYTIYRYSTAAGKNNTGKELVCLGSS